MAKLLKKYWLWFLWILVAGLILFYFIPKQKYRYLDEDFKQIETSSTILVFILAGVLSLFVVIRFIKNSKSFNEIPSLILSILGIASISFFVLKPFVQSGIYFLNGLKTDEVVIKKYLVEYIHTDPTSLTFYDTENKKLLSFEKCLRVNSISKVLIKDTVYFEFKKGLIGFIHDPKIRTE